MYSLADIRVVISKIRWADHAACMEEMRHPNKMLVSVH